MRKSNETVIFFAITSDIDQTTNFDQTLYYNYK